MPHRRIVACVASSEVRSSFTAFLALGLPAVFVGCHASKTIIKCDQLKKVRSKLTKTTSTASTIRCESTRGEIAGIFSR